MQFKVPQDVQQADRIVAFLTLAQLIICVVGFGFAYAVYTILYRQGLPGVLWFPPVAFIGLLTAAFAFLKIANLPFHRYLIILLERIVTPSKRMWVKGMDRVVVDENYVEPEELKAKEAQKKVEAAQTEKEESLKNVGDITDMLDTLKKAEPPPAPATTPVPPAPVQMAFVSPPPAKEGDQGGGLVLKKKRKRRRKKKFQEPTPFLPPRDSSARPPTSVGMTEKKEAALPMIVEEPHVPMIVEEPAVPMIVEEPTSPRFAAGEPPLSLPVRQAGLAGEGKAEQKVSPPPAKERDQGGGPTMSQSLTADQLRQGATITFDPQP